VAKTSGWFEVSKDGLRKLIEDRKKSFIIYELLQNAWDEKCSTVMVNLSPVSRGKVNLVVSDDNPGGFADLTHAYRMFEESAKKVNPEQRGRFNVGEKLFLALCDEASIASTSGCVIFNKDGTRSQGNKGTDIGTIIQALLPMTQAEYEQVCNDVRLLLPPPGITTTFNGVPLAPRTPRTGFETTLPTVLADDSGVLRKTKRKTKVEVYDVAEGETASIFEMGIPIVETGDRFHVNVMQKVPQNTDRDNVTPAYLSQLRTEVLNATFSAIHTEEQANEAWVRNALADERISPEAVRKVITTAFGPMVVSHDPRDSEASSTAASEGYRVVYGGAFPAAAWQNIKKAEAMQAASVQFPTPKAYSDDPDAPKAVLIPEDKYTDGMRDVATLTKELCRRYLGHGCEVKIVDADGSFYACHIGHPVPNFTEFHFNRRAHGTAWFNVKENLAGVLTEIAHEFAHDAASNHLDAKFYRAIENFTGWVAVLMRDEPEVFAPGLTSTLVEC
jgi:hypothetical protein